MIENGQTVGFVREHHKHSLRSQRGLMASHRITKIYDDLALCIQQRRVKQGDVVAVKRLALLADPKQKRRPGGVRQALYKAVDDLEAAGAYVVEAMRADGLVGITESIALKLLKGSGRSPGPKSDRK
jgi:putative ubiquitin-RnfH superfamily antitoxin RatB of RatAB toxin-antitoxin module